MPEVMFHYRAASWFANRHCPEVKMGFMTTEEAQEIPNRKHVDSVVSGVAGVKEALKGKKKATDGEQGKDVPKETTDDDGGKEAPQADPTTEVVPKGTPVQLADNSSTKTDTAPDAESGQSEAAPSPDPQSAPDADENEGAQADSATTAKKSSPEYMCKGCGVSPTKVNVRKVKGKDKRFCDACMSSKVVEIK